MSSAAEQEAAQEAVQEGRGPSPRTRPAAVGNGRRRTAAGTAQTPVWPGAPDAARGAVPGGPRRGGGHQLRAVGGRGGGGGAVPVRRRRARRARVPLTELTHEIWHGFVPGRPARASGTATGCTAAGTPGPAPAGTRRSCSSTRTPVRWTGPRQDSAAAARGVRARPRLAAAAGRGHRARRPGLGAVRTEGRRRPRGRARRRVDGRPPPEDAVGGLGDLRAACARLHQAASRASRRNCAAPTPGLAHPAAIEHLVKLGVTAVELLPVHQFAHEDHLLRRGLKNYWGYNSIGYFAPHAAYAASGTTRPAGRRVQADGARAARGGHRGHPRRGLQPHRGGGRAGPDAVAARHRQPRLLPAAARRPPLRGLHGLRQHPARRPAAGAAPDHGLAAVLGDGDGGGRLPVRPGGGAGPLPCTTSTCCPRSSRSSRRTRCCGG